MVMQGPPPSGFCVELAGYCTKFWCQQTDLLFLLPAMLMVFFIFEEESTWLWILQSDAISSEDKYQTSIISFGT